MDRLDWILILLLLQLLVLLALLLLLAFIWTGFAGILHAPLIP